MRQFKVLASLLFSALFLLGCNSNDIVGKLAPTNRVTRAQADVRLLMDGQFEQISEHLDPSLRNEKLDANLAQMRKLFPDEKPSSIQVIGYHYRIQNAVRFDDVTLQYSYPDQWVFVDYTTRDGDDGVEVVNFRADPLPDALEHWNRFTFAGKGPKQFGVLFMAILSVGFSVAVFVICLKTPIRKRKWAWAILTLVGVMQVNVNWTTGRLGWLLFWIIIPSGTYSQIPYSPIFICASIPVGAIVFLLRRKRLAAEADKRSLEAVNLA